LTRPKHWQEFIPFAMAHTPLKMTIEEAHAELRAGWAQAYSPEAMARLRFVKDKPLGYRINIFIARMCFPRQFISLNGPSGVAEIDLSKWPYHFGLVREGSLPGTAGPLGRPPDETFDTGVPAA